MGRQVEEILVDKSISKQKVEILGEFATRIHFIYLQQMEISLVAAALLTAFLFGEKALILQASPSPNLIGLL